MVILQLPPDLRVKLAQELNRAGCYEVGGILVGEHVEAESFRIVDLSVQRTGGETMCFVRRPEEHRAFLDIFFKRTGTAYERFNYLGEWHSHPNSEVRPSRVDRRQMQAIVEEEVNAPLFAILLVVQLEQQTLIRISATAFRRGYPPEAVDVVLSERPVDDPTQVSLSGSDNYSCCHAPNAASSSSEPDPKVSNDS